MNLSQVIQKFTPGPWVLIDLRHQGESVRVAGALLPHRNIRPVICELWTPNWRANASLITAAPELLIGLYLALQALKQSNLRQAALQRGLAVINRVTDHSQVQPDQAVLARLRKFGVIEPTLTELALTTTPELAAGWIRYARDQSLGTGFVVSQLRAGRQLPPDRVPKTWYTEEERLKFMIS